MNQPPPNSSADRIRALADSGTPGPWTVGEVTPGTWAEHIPAYADIEPMIAGGIDPTDAAKIVAAVNALPKVAALVAAIEDHTSNGRIYGCVIDGLSGACDCIPAAAADLCATLGVDQ